MKMLMNNWQFIQFIAFVPTVFLIVDYLWSKRP